jgi:predicted transcriptional regulator
LEGKELLERLLSSESKGELLMLFHKNPGLVDSMEGVARRIGKGPEQIDGDVKDFIEMGLLKTTAAGKMVLISFSKERDKEIQESVTRYIKGGTK